MSFCKNCGHHEFYHILYLGNGETEADCMWNEGRCDCPRYEPLVAP